MSEVCKAGRRCCCSERAVFSCASVQVMNEVSRDASEMCMEQAYGIARQFCYFQWGSCNKLPVSIKQMFWTSQSMLWEWKSGAPGDSPPPKATGWQVSVDSTVTILVCILPLSEEKHVCAISCANIYWMYVQSCTRVFQLSLTGSLEKGSEESIWLLLVRGSLLQRCLVLCLQLHEVAVTL